MYIFWGHFILRLFHVVFAQLSSEALSTHKPFKAVYLKVACVVCVGTRSHTYRYAQGNSSGCRLSEKKLLLVVELAAFEVVTS